MNNKFLLSIAFLIGSLFSYAQTDINFEKNQSKINLVFVPKLGYAKMTQTSQPKLNGFVNGGDVLVAFKLNKSSSLSTGVGYFEFDANTTFDGNSASINNTYLHIPINYVSNFSVFRSKGANETVFLAATLGLYANSLLKQDFETATDNFTDKNLGWNFGFSTYVGLKFIASDLMTLGIGLETNNDFTKIEKDGLKQKLDLTTLNINIAFRLK